MRMVRMTAKKVMFCATARELHAGAADEERPQRRRRSEA